MCVFLFWRGGGGGGMLLLTEKHPREDATFRRIFKEAKLKLVQVELQKGFQSSGLLPVRMYALKPE